MRTSPGLRFNNISEQSERASGDGWLLHTLSRLCTKLPKGGWTPVQAAAGAAQVLLAPAEVVQADVGAGAAAAGAGHQDASPPPTTAATTNG